MNINLSQFAAGKMTPQKLGDAGEIFLSRYLNCDRLRLAGHDLQFKNKKIEVKTAKLDKKNTAGICAKKEGHTNCKNSEIIIVLVVDSEFELQSIYLIPAKLINSQFVRISQKGKYAEFKIELHNLAEKLQ